MNNNIDTDQMNIYDIRRMADDLLFGVDTLVDLLENDELHASRVARQMIKDLAIELVEALGD